MLPSRPPLLLLLLLPLLLLCPAGGAADSLRPETEAAAEVETPAAHDDAATVKEVAEETATETSVAGRSLAAGAGVPALPLDADSAQQYNYVLEGAAAGPGGDAAGVRKCCEPGFFFSTQSQQCEAAGGEDTGFEVAARHLRQVDAGGQGALRVVPGKLSPCPGTGGPPVISEVSLDSHLLLEGGHLRSDVTGYDHDHDHYCLEMAAPDADLLLGGGGVLVAAQCVPWPQKVLARKCCPLDHYYDHALGHCRPSLANMSDADTLVREFIHLDDGGGADVRVTTGKLLCNRGTPRLVVADQAFLDASSNLCERLSDKCHDTASYCVEYMWAAGDTTMTAVASVCPVEAFHKCCPGGHVLTDEGCAPGDVSARMRQLLEVLDPHYGFPTENGGELCVQELITPDDDDVQWWISKSGYLSVDTRGDSHDTMRYCVDDYLGPANRSQTVAVLCHAELEELVHVHLSLHPSQAGSVGKCCPHGHYFSAASGSCRPDELGLELLQHPQVIAANVTKLTFTSFPECQAAGGYHHYYVGRGALDDDHALLTPDHLLEVVALESGCEFTRHAFPRHAYCLEYTVDGGGVRRPGVLVCPGAWRGYNLHTEKFGLTGILLGVSCAALFATAASLISTRVRRGLVTVKKVNTLAGRILLSYVLSYLVGFLLLMVNMKVEVEEGNNECQVMAWLLIFFLLAGFQWNTSICLESLLLTLHVETSENLRYLYHSLWAWGAPAVIASLALTLDHYRQSLPCSVVTPKVGLYRCFFSDPTATLLYFFLPMLLTLVANMVLLLVSRYVRAEKLRRLEGGPARSNDREGGTEMQGRTDPSKPPSAPSPAPAPRAPAPKRQAPTSGLRVHHTRNTWLESVKLVVWSGVTWLLEVASFVITKYMVNPSESWYDYLWYVPSSVNALRGVGIFVILVLTPERRIQIRRTLLGLARQSGVHAFSKSRNGEASSTFGRHGSDMPSSGAISEVRLRPEGGGGGSLGGAQRRRNMSIATTLTQLSSIRSSRSDSRSDDSHHHANASNAPSNASSSAPCPSHPHLATSVSQLDTRRSSVSSQSSDGDGSELDIEATGPAGGRRRSSLATFGVVALPSVHEEEDGPPSLVPDNVSEA